MDLNHNTQVQEYIRTVCAQVKLRDVHHEVGLELQTHIQEIAEDHIAQGSLEKEAVKMALTKMGDADVIGKQLNKVHKPTPEWFVLLFSMLFIFLGLLIMYIIQKQGLLAYDIQIFNNSLFFAVVSLFLIIGLYFFDYRHLEKYSKHIYAGTLFLLFITILWGKEFQGSRSWFAIGALSINFVAMSPLCFMVAFAGMFHKWDWNSNLKLLQGLTLFAVPCAFILAAPSVSTGIVYAVACMVIMLVSGANFKKMIFVTSPLPALLGLSLFSKSYRLNRLLTFLNPEADPLGSGYLNIQLHKMIADSGLWGHGFTFNAQAVPEIHTDFIFTFITYTFGWIASTLLITFIVLFLVRIARIAGEVKTSYAKLLICGFVSILTIQFLWNIAMNLGLAPISRFGLPFMSYGGSQLIINGATVGIISSIYRRKSLNQNRSLS